METERTLKGICDTLDALNKLSSCCPVRCSRAQLQDMSALTEKLIIPNELPAFPNPSGEFVEKKDMVNTLACGKSYTKFYSITEVPANAKHCSQCTKLYAFPNMEDPSDSEEPGTP